MKRFYLLLTLALFVPAIRAVVIADVDGSGNVSAPADDPGWANVGRIGGASGVYLGNYGGQYWVLTASHVGAGDILLGSTTYSAVSGSSVGVLNGNGTPADLTLFRISSDPLLPKLTLSSSRPSTTSQILTIGSGLDRVLSPNTGNNLAGWTLTGSGASLAWQEQVSGSVDVVGFYEGTTRSKRWGLNNIEGVVVQNYGFGTTTLLFSDFDIVSGESQGATGDSGGAAFYKNGATWELAGIMGATGQYPNQPAHTAVLGNETYYADLSTYQSFILTAIPEPSDFAMGCGAVVLAIAGWRRRRAWL